MPLETTTSTALYREPEVRLERQASFEPPYAARASAEAATRVKEPEKAEGKRGEESGLRRERAERAPTCGKSPHSVDQRGRIIDLEV